MSNITRRQIARAIKTIQAALDERENYAGTCSVIVRPSGIAMRGASVELRNSYEQAVALNSHEVVSELFKSIR